MRGHSPDQQHPSIVTNMSRYSRTDGLTSPQFFDPPHIRDISEAKGYKLHIVRSK